MQHDLVLALGLALFASMHIQQLTQHTITCHFNDNVNWKMKAKQHRSLVHRHWNLKLCKNYNPLTLLSLHTHSSQTEIRIYKTHDGLSVCVHGSVCVCVRSLRNINEHKATTIKSEPKPTGTWKPFITISWKRNPHRIQKQLRHNETTMTIVSIMSTFSTESMMSTLSTESMMSTLSTDSMMSTLSTESVMST